MPGTSILAGAAPRLNAGIPISSSRVRARIRSSRRTQRQWQQQRQRLRRRPATATGDSVRRQQQRQQTANSGQRPRRVSQRGDRHGFEFRSGQIIARYPRRVGQRRCQARRLDSIAPETLHSKACLAPALAFPDRELPRRAILSTPSPRLPPLTMSRARSCSGWSSRTRKSSGVARPRDALLCVRTRLRAGGTPFAVRGPPFAERCSLFPAAVRRLLPLPPIADADSGSDAGTDADAVRSRAGTRGLPCRWAPSGAAPRCPPPPRPGSRRPSRARGS